MPLDSRKLAHVAANRAGIRRGRSETVTLVTGGGGMTGYLAVPGVVWHDAGQVAAGVTSRAGEITRQPWDALAEFPGEVAFPEMLRVVARTATATAAGVAAAAGYTVLDRVRVGLGAGGNRWMVKLRLIR